MIDKPLAGRTIAILLANGFEEEEFTEPQKKLIQAGATTKIVSSANGLVNGWYEGSWGHFFPIDQDLAETLAIDYDGLIVPGGIRAVQKLSEEPHATRVVKAFVRAGAPVAIIGDAVGMLATVELAKGRTLTSSADARETLEAAGASWEDQPFVAEGNLVTTNGASSLSDAMNTFIESVAAYDAEAAQAA
jgi:protease I